VEVEHTGGSPGILGLSVGLEEVVGEEVGEEVEEVEEVSVRYNTVH